MTDYWAHAHLDNPSLEKEVYAETAGFEDELAAMEAADAALPGDSPDGWETVADDAYGGTR